MTTPNEAKLILLFTEREEQPVSKAPSTVLSKASYGDKEKTKEE